MKGALKAFIMMVLALLTVPGLAWASTPLSSVSPGSVITFSGKQWVVLEQMPDGTTYILLNSNDGDRAFDPDNTQIFNPSDSNNIGYYLNNNFYNGLSQKELIDSHSWDIKFEDGSGSQSNVTAKVGLISYSEYESYSSYYDGSVLPDSYSYYWWTRTPRSSNSSYVWNVDSGGYLNLYSFACYSRGVRPALYLQSGILVSDTKEVIGTGGDVEPPSVPTGFSGSAASPTEIQLDWDANNEEDLEGYKIYRDGNLIGQVVENNYTEISLDPETEYTYKVSAYDTTGNESGQSSPINITTPAQEDETPPAIPTGLEANAVDSTTVELTWDANTEPDFASYDIYRNGEKITATAATNHTDMNLEPETEYTYTITAGDSSANYSEQCDPVTVTTQASSVELTSPENLHVSNITDITAVAQWDSVDGADSYKVYIDGVEFGVATENNYDLSLNPETEYVVTVTSLSGVQESPASEPVTFTTMTAPLDAPGVPYFSASSSIVGGSVSLSWSYDDPTISKWEVYMDGALIEECPGDSTGTTVKGLEKGSYSFKVRPFNSAGAGEFSEILTVGVSSFSGFTTNIIDIFTMIGLLMKSIWPLLAFAIALAAAPKIINTVKNTMAARR